MKINYNNEIYEFTHFQTVKDLMSINKFMELPLNIWFDILNMKEGFVSYNKLYKILVDKILYYDKSRDINSFIFNNKLYWLNKDTRVGLVNLANSTNENIILFLDPDFIEISPIKLKQHLSKIEVYSNKCYIQTQKHLQNIQQLQTIEDLINYDYTTGYPEKVILE